jgi:enoyl-CoA hydratase/carnithine racemase
MTPSFSTISVVLQKNSGRITLNNPPLNVITPVMIEELIQSLAEIESNPDISVIVIDGKGSSFSAGVAVAAHNARQRPGNVDQISWGGPCFDQQQENYGVESSRELPWWWCGTGDGL